MQRGSGRSRGSSVPRRAIFVAGQESPPLEILSFQLDMVTRIAMVAVSLFHFCLTRRSAQAHCIGSICLTTGLVALLHETPGLSKYRQIDCIERFDKSGLHMRDLSFLKGNALALRRNLDTGSGLANGQGCSIQELGNRPFLPQFDEGTERTLVRIRRGTVINGIRSVTAESPHRPTAGLSLVPLSTVAHNTESMANCKSPCLE
jgi:hypothetical protein